MNSEGGGHKSWRAYSKCSVKIVENPVIVERFWVKKQSTNEVLLHHALSGTRSTQLDSTRFV